MRVRHRYPFEALHGLRHLRVDRQAAAVSESAARTEQACREESRRELERQSSERLISETSQSERSRLEEGQLRAGDLQLAGDWRKGAEAEVRVKAELGQRAREARVAQAEIEAAERRALGTASNQAKTIDTHRVMFHAERDAARERSDDEAATEQWTASHFPQRRS
ncbi:MAG: hypothetical protein ABIQ16_06365 [Polyangiaceae bacterium]